MYVTNNNQQKQLVLRPHNFSAKIKHTSIIYCRRCGLVPANNDATRKLINKGCYMNLNAKE